MKRYILLLTLPSLAMAMERTAAGPTTGMGGGRAGGGSVTLPVCHPQQVLTVRNGAFACMNIQPNIVLVGSCTTALIAPQRYRTEVLCPVGYSLIGCSGGARSRATATGAQVIEPFMQNDRMGCRSSATNASTAQTSVYAQCMGEPGLTPSFVIQSATGCWTPATDPGGDAPAGWSDAGEGGDAGGDSGGDGDGDGDGDS